MQNKQLLTYLRLADRRLGLLINFGDVLTKNGITRIVNGLEEKYFESIPSLCVFARWREVIKTAHP